LFGYFKNDKADGPSVQINKSGVIYEGTMKNGSFIGTVNVTSPKGSSSLSEVPKMFSPRKQGKQLVIDSETDAKSKD
jgi:hypothetical protein